MLSPESIATWYLERALEIDDWTGLGGWGVWRCLLYCEYVTLWSQTPIKITLNPIDCFLFLPSHSFQFRSQ